MAYGLVIYGNTGNVRLSTEDRQVRYIGTYSGTVSAGSSANVTVSGMTDDGTRGLNQIDVSGYGTLSIHSNKFTVTNSTANSLTYKVQVFRI